MASLEDNLVGNRKENFIGDSDSEHEKEDEADRGQLLPNVDVPVSDGLPQTGPKGVLTDYYRKMEEDKRKDVLAKEKRKEMILQHSATVQSQAAEAAEAAAESSALVNVAKALEEGSLDADPFLRQYRAKRMEELKQQASAGPRRKRFGNLVEVRGDKYDMLIDNSPPGVLLIIHLYDEIYPECVYMNKALTRLAKYYPTAKFCRVQCSQLGVSKDFSEKALPTLMVYCDGEVIGNHVRVTSSLDKNYTDEDLEAFLHEKKCLPPEGKKEDPHFMGGLMGGANKILGTTNRNRLDSSDSD